MSLTMIDPASSWFEIAELPIVQQLHQQTVNSKELLIADEIIDKTLEHIAQLVHKTWLCRYPREVSLNCILSTCVNHMVSRVSQPRLRIHEQIAYWNMYIKSYDKCYAQLN
jgi:hypothetical protein